jgi:DNA-binding GntR family transcriptional regulator
MYPGGAYAKAANATEIFLRKHSSFLQGNVLNNPELMAKYYRDFYSLDESVTTHKDLFQAVQAGDFRETAKLYRLIEGDQINILVPYKKSTFNRLKEMLNSEHRPPRFVASWIREARQFSVSIHRPDRNHVLWNYLDPVQFSRAKHLDIDEADWFILLNEDLYDETLGLKTELEFDGVNYY